MAHLAKPRTFWAGRLGRRLIFGLDNQLGRYEGIYAFSQDPNCVLRISHGTSPEERVLADGTIVHAGDPVLELHWWNERISQMAATGSSLHWGLLFYRHTYYSLIELARYMDETPGLRDIVALHGETTFSSDLSYRHHASAFRRLGFELESLPSANAPGEFTILFFRHFHVWALTWACNPTSLRGKLPWEAVRSEVWISRQALMERCIGAASPPLSPEDATWRRAGAVHDMARARVKRVMPRVTGAAAGSSSRNAAAWKLLRAYVRSHSSIWRR